MSPVLAKEIAIRRCPIISGTVVLCFELCRELGDDGGLKAAYRGGCRACQNLSRRAIRHEHIYQCCPPTSARRARGSSDGCPALGGSTASGPGCGAGGRDVLGGNAGSQAA